jgi:predicted ThiF/HesA family dinucleotide-utilizing enzyme
MIDMSKKYSIRDGVDVRIYSVDGGGQYPVHGAIIRPNGEWGQESWTQSGCFCRGEEASRRDLVEVKAEVWIWVLGNGETCGKHHNTREECEASLRAESGRAVRFVQEDE